MTRVTVLFYRLGPYHLARLRSAARHLDVTAIEYAQVDTIYGWNVVPDADGFHRVTLFQDDAFEKVRTAPVYARVAHALAESRPEAVAIPGWGERCSLSALRWCLHQGVPAIVMSESTAWDEARRTHKEWVKGRVVSAFSAGLVGGTPHRDYLASLGMSPNRVFTGYDAVDNAYFKSEAEGGRRKAQELRAKHGLPERYFLASARFVEKKNLPRLLQAYARYRGKAEKLTTEMLKGDTGKAESRKRKAEIWDLVLLGDGPLKADLCRLISDLRLDACVHLPGFKQYPDLPAFYGLASVFIHASTTEQWGLVVNEAMASGLPVLVSNRCGCAPDLVQEGVNGFTFDPCNVEELAQLMLKISAFQPFSLSAFGDASRRIISDWGPERFAAGLQAAVETAVRSPRPPARLFERLLLSAIAMK